MSSEDDLLARVRMLSEQVSILADDDDMDDTINISDDEAKDLDDEFLRSGNLLYDLEFEDEEKMPDPGDNLSRLQQAVSDFFITIDEDEDQFIFDDDAETFKRRLKMHPAEKFRPLLHWLKLLPTPNRTIRELSRDMFLDYVSQAVLQFSKDDEDQAVRIMVDLTNLVQLSIDREEQNEKAEEDSYIQKLEAERKLHEEVSVESLEDYSRPITETPSEVSVEEVDDHFAMHQPNITTYGDDDESDAELEAEDEHYPKHQYSVSVEEEPGSEPLAAAAAAAAGSGEYYPHQDHSQLSVEDNDLTAEEHVESLRTLPMYGETVDSAEFEDGMDITRGQESQPKRDIGNQIASRDSEDDLDVEDLEEDENEFKQEEQVIQEPTKKKNKRRIVIPTEGNVETVESLTNKSKKSKRKKKVRGVSKRDPTKGTAKGDPTDFMSLDYGMASNNDSLAPKRKKKKSRVRKSTRSTPTHTRSLSENVTGARKKGPRDTGRASGFKAYRAKTTVDDGIFTERLGSRSSGSTDLFKERKKGPREIGRTTGWKRAKYDMKTSDSFYEKPPLMYSKSAHASTMFTERKKGPREIGIARGYRMPKFKDPVFLKHQISSAHSDPINSERLDSSRPVIFRVERKKGPRDYGRPEGWKPPPKEWRSALLIENYNSSSSFERSSSVPHHQRSKSMTTARKSTRRRRDPARSVGFAANDNSMDDMFNEPGAQKAKIIRRRRPKRGAFSAPSTTLTNTMNNTNNITDSTEDYDLEAEESAKAVIQKLQSSKEANKYGLEDFDRVATSVPVKAKKRPALDGLFTPATEEDPEYEEAFDFEDEEEEEAYRGLDEYEEDEELDYDSGVKFEDNVQMIDSMDSIRHLEEMVSNVMEEDDEEEEEDYVPELEDFENEYDHELNVVNLEDSDMDLDVDSDDEI